jgi:hypothetical protein
MAAVVGVPLTLVGLVIAFLSLRGGDDGKKPPARAALKAVALVVHNGGGGPQLDVGVHNVGDRRAVLTRARLTVERVDSVPVCVSAGGLNVTGTYNAILPPHPGAVDVPLHQQVGRDEADRFTIKIGATQKSLSSEDGRPRKLLYRLGLSLVDDSGGPAAIAGTAIVSVPLVPEQTEDFWSTGLQSKTRPQLDALLPGFPLASFVPCWRKNNARLRAALSAPGARAPELDQLRGQIANDVVLPKR